MAFAIVGAYAVAEYWAVATPCKRVRRGRPHGAPRRGRGPALRRAADGRRDELLADPPGDCLSCRPTRDSHGYHHGVAATYGIVGPAVSACARRRQGSPLRSDPAARGSGLDAGSAHACLDRPFNDDALSYAPLEFAPRRATVEHPRSQRRATACRPPRPRSGSCRRRVDDAGRGSSAALR